MNEALYGTLADAGLALADMEPTASLWQAGAGERGITGSTFYSRFRRYLRAAALPPSGLHILRHSAAKLRRDTGASIEAISSFLDHSSLAVTCVYLRRLEGETDRTWPDVAVAIGGSVDGRSRCDPDADRSPYDEVPGSRPTGSLSTTESWAGP